MAEGRVFTWQSAAGDKLKLSDRANGFWVLRGVTGLGKPKYSIDTSPKADGVGSYVGKVRATDRSVFLPLHIQGSTRRDYLLKKQALSSLMDPTMGEGLLTIEDAGFKVYLKAIYESGMEGDESRGVDAGFTGDVDGYWGKTGIVLHSYDPYFYSYDSIPIDLPLSVLDGRTITINNPGDKPTYVPWRLFGPSTSFIARSLTLSRVVSTAVNFPGTTNQALNIGMDLRQVTTYIDQPGIGSGFYFSVIGGSQVLLDQYWPLIPGDNQVQFTVTGGTSATRLRASIVPRIEALV